ncbi:MAG: fasciclin domain-containing protein [Prevotella sp.]|nr:fasciclin domain-containing protein [Prevotella sp.]
MKKNKYIGIMMLAATMLTAASCTEYDDYNKAPTDALPGANQTLWENISGDPQLSKFAELAKKSNYAEVLNSPRFYTVWAPVNDAFDDAEYERLKNSSDSVIEKQFMQQHITEYNYQVSAALDSTTIVSLNDKHHPFTQSAFDGFTYSAINIPSTNGVMHKINGMSEFHYNLYENIDNLGDTLLKKYIQKYDEEYLDVSASVIGPLKDGKQTYLDSVMKKRNTVINTIMRASLDNEDSTYCMLLPTDKAWNDTYNKILPCYNYIAKMDYMDLSKNTTVASSTTATTAKAEKAVETTGAELQDSIACRNIVTNLVFSNSNPKNAPLFGNGTLAAADTIVTTTGRGLTNAQGVIGHTTSLEELSNGMARVVDSLTFSSWETFNPVIATYRPAQTLKVTRLTNHSVYSTGSTPLKDFPIFRKVPKMFHQWLFPENSPYFTYVAVDSAYVDGTTGKPEFKFALKNVRSATYHIYVVTVPPQLEEPTADVKPYYLRFYLSYTDAANKQQYIVLPQGARTTSEITTDNGTSTATITYVGDPECVNVIDLGEFTFPACYYGLDAYPSLMMMHTKSYTSSANRKKYDQQMRVAGVYLVPKEYNDLWANDNE